MKYIFANWKSNKNRKDAEHWMDEFDKNYAHFASHEDLEIIIAPPMPSLMFISNRLLDRQKHPHVYLAVQDLSSYPAGSYTGAVSTVNLEGFNVKYAILGHSERRNYFEESDMDVAKKVDQAVEAGITPVVCVDEDYIESQAYAIDKKHHKKCIVAYEPLSAIGTGDEMNPKKVVEVVNRIRKAFGDVRVIYGGSVDGDNVKDYLEVCDGVLVGGASLKVDEFKRLV
ncbi:MAG: triose-phosphate isomerase [Candidatus Pacebacteria bacterium]|nr:triose-phosphate isomerase [Candidatus Paceibacterota bacterium]